MNNNMKKMTLSFVLESDDKWYIDLPNWPFAHHNLQMVAGADDLLDELGELRRKTHIDEVLKASREEPYERCEEIDEMFEDELQMYDNIYEGIEVVDEESKEQARRKYYDYMDGLSRQVYFERMLGSAVRRVTIDVYLGNTFCGQNFDDDYLLYCRKKWSVAGGAFYNRTSNRKEMPLKMWLCPVTLFVCHKYPQCVAIDLKNIEIGFGAPTSEAYALRQLRRKVKAHREGKENKQ